MKKILSLFALLLTIVIGAKADAVTLFDAADLDGETVTSGTVTMDNSKWYGGSSASVDAGKTIGGVTWSNRIKFGGGSTFKTGSDFSRVLEVTVPSAGTLNVYFLSGSKNKTRYVYVSANPSSTNRDTSTAVISGSDDGNDGNVASGEVSAGTYYVWCAENIGVMGVTFESSATTAPTITTDLSATADVTVGVAEDFTIVADGATSYQWYKDNVAIEGATSATYSYTAEAAGTVNLKCVASNSIGDTPSTVCAVTATAPASAPEITTDLDAEYSVQKGQSITLSIVAEGASEYQWYLDNVAIVGATSDSYEYTANNEVGQAVAIYCVASNAAGDTGSQIATVTTTGSDKCQLISVKFSTGVYGAITEPTPAKEDDPATAEDESAPAQNGKVEVPYTAGTLYPEIFSTSVQVSEDAVFYATEDAIVVNAQDGVTSATYDLEFVAVTPLEVIADVATTDFTEVPSWVFNKYGYDNDKGLKFAKAVNDASNMRIAKGNTRQYYFIGAAKNITFTKKGNTRKVNVYVNGTKVINDTNNDNLGAIELDENGNNIVMIESNQTGGDGGFASYAIEAVVPVTETITIPAEGVVTYVTQNPLDFSTQNGAFKAYVVTAANASKVTTEVVEQVPAGTALLIKGAEGSYDVATIASATAPTTNLFQISDGSVTGEAGNVYAYSKGSLKFKKVAASVTIPEDKCYLVINGAGQSIDIDFDEQATAIGNVNANDNANFAPVKVIKNGKLFIGNFNVAGQQVK